MSEQIITRIAPSPTGYFHIGTARTALFNFLFARHMGGRFLVRVEDTDRARSTQEFEDDILEGMRQLGLTWDDFSRQSERSPVHRERLQTLIAAGKAYCSSEPAKDDPTRTVEVVRLRNPGKSVVFHDQVRGDIVFDTTELGDFVIARSLDDPLYHFAVVVDDADSGVTHVIRGEDHISNTPRQILIQEALGYARPVYVHIPLILAPDRSKMSKRKGATAVRQFIADGYFPQALVNFIALLGWNPGTDRELFTLDELITNFSIDGLQKSGAVFDVERLKWFNREHRKRIDIEDVRATVLSALSAYPDTVHMLSRSSRACDDLIERFATTGDLLRAFSEGEYDFYKQDPEPQRAFLPWKKDPTPERTGERLRNVRTLLASLEESAFSYERTSAAIGPFAETEGKGNVLWPLRYALSGKERSPDPFLLLEALGKTCALARIDRAILTLAS